MGKRPVAKKAKADDFVIIPESPPVQTVQNPASVAKDYERQLSNSAKRQVIGQREKYADAALGVFQAWVGFTIVFIIFQFVLTVLGTPLPTADFIAVVVTSASSVVGLAYIVGKFLFPSEGTKDMFKH